MAEPQAEEKSLKKEKAGSTAFHFLAQGGGNSGNTRAHSPRRRRREGTNGKDASCVNNDTLDPQGEGDCEAIASGCKVFLFGINNYGEMNLEKKG